MGIDTGLGTRAHAQAAVDFFWLQPDAKAVLERETGIEPASSAWKAEVLPLNYSRTEQLVRNSLLVEEAGFEPAYALAGRFTVCCL